MPFWLSGFGIHIATAVVQVAAVAWVRSLARELPCAMGTAKKKNKKKGKKGLGVGGCPPEQV